MTNLVTIIVICIHRNLNIKIFMTYRIYKVMQTTYVYLWTVCLVNRQANFFTKTIARLTNLEILLQERFVLHFVYMMCD